MPVAFGIAQPAHACGRRIVLDPTNFVQNTLTAVRTLEQINNQIHQLQNEAQMLMNQARNLASLPTSTSSASCASTLATTAAPDRAGQGPGLRRGRASTKTFARLYPEQYAATISGDQMLARCAGALEEHAQRPADRDADAGAGVAEPDAMTKRAGRPGGPEPVGRRARCKRCRPRTSLLALQAKQSIQSQRLQITQDRAASLELARQAAATERAREVRRRFLGEGTPYTPQSINFYTRLTGGSPCDGTLWPCLGCGVQRPTALREAADPCG